MSKADTLVFFSKSAAEEEASKHDYSYISVADTGLYYVYIEDFDNE